MGIVLGITVSKHVPEERWADVYQEVTGLAKEIGLATRKVTEIRGRNVRCLTLLSEDKDGWNASADYETLGYAETFFFPARLDMPNGEGTGDPVVYYAWETGRLDIPQPGENLQELWGEKTQGHLYHSLLLALGCLVQDRLGDQAFVHGDINAGQCRHVVEWLNGMLEAPIQGPCQCDADPWLERVSRTPLDPVNKVRLAVNLFLGRKDVAFGDTLRAAFSQEALTQYWRETFGEHTLQSVGFADTVQDYLAMGFDVGEMFDLISETPADPDDDPREFLVFRILESKMHWAKKDCSDIMVQDPEDPTRYGIEAQILRALSAGAKNRKVDRYIPLDELRRIFREHAGLTADEITDRYLQQEQELEAMNRSKKINNMMNEYKAEIEEKSGKEILLLESQLIQYTPEYTVSNDMETLIRKILETAEEATMKKIYETLVSGTADRRKDWLATHNHFWNLRDCDWEKMLKAAGDDPDGFRRYFSLFCIEVKEKRIYDAVVALIVNDALYVHNARTAHE